jgi:hypothetical protein
MNWHNHRTGHVVTMTSLAKPHGLHGRQIFYACRAYWQEMPARPSADQRASTADRLAVRIDWFAGSGNA